MSPHLSPTNDPAIEAARIGAVHRLAFARKQHPGLSQRVAQANVDLAAAIMAMDEAEDTPGRHNLYEQAAVELATQRYAQALADLVRGDDSRSEVTTS